MCCLVPLKEFVDVRQFQERGSRFPLHDNVRPYFAETVKQFWQNIRFRINGIGSILH